MLDEAGGRQLADLMNTPNCNSRYILLVCKNKESILCNVSFCIEDNST